MTAAIAVDESHVVFLIYVGDICVVLANACDELTPTHIYETRRRRNISGITLFQSLWIARWWSQVFQDENATIHSAGETWALLQKVQPHPQGDVAASEPLGSAPRQPSAEPTIQRRSIGASGSEGVEFLLLFVRIQIPLMPAPRRRHAQYRTIQTGFYSSTTPEKPMTWVIDQRHQGKNCRVSRPMRQDSMWHTHKGRLED